MNVEPKTYGLGYDDPSIETTPGAELGSLWIQCRTLSPESARGRTVHVYLEPDVVELLLRELRTTAIRRRQLRNETPVEEAARWKQAGIEARARGRMRP